MDISRYSTVVTNSSAWSIKIKVEYYVRSTNESEVQSHSYNLSDQIEINLYNY